MNSRFSLAVHVLCLLATTSEERLTSEYIATSIGTNAVVIRRLLAKLRRFGLVTSKSAGGGGWMLAHPATDITLDRVRQAMAEGEAAKIHKNSPHPACPVGKGVRQTLIDLYHQADVALDRELAGISVAGILASVLKQETALTSRAQPVS